MGTLWSSIKLIKARYMFHWEQGIALDAMQGNRASSLSEQEDSWFFSSCGGKMGYIHELRWDGHSKLEFVQGSHDFCLIMTDTSGI